MMACLPLALMALGLAFVSCEEPDNGGGGTTTFTVTFNLNGGSGTAPSAQPVKDGESITLPGGSGLTRSGYIFGGWNTKNDGTGTDYSAGSSYTVTGNITLYAKWIDPEIQVPGESLAEKLQWLVSNAESNGAYVLELSTAYESIGPQTLSYTGRRNISVRLRGSGNSARVVELSSNGSLFTIENGVTLILDNNIALSGRSGNETSVIRINSGGTFTMSGGTISGNTTYDAVSSYGGGVSVNGGTFTMSGGTISGNAGGVSVGSGTFTMNGGTISGNTASNYGGGFGGVSVGSGTFTMSGGTIFGNSSYRGGGVYVDSGTFTMSGGTISGNAASSSSYTGNAYGGGVYVSGGTFNMSSGEISGNTASNYGGGVYVYGTFNKTGGTIYGYDANDTVNSNVVKNSSGVVLSDRGHAVNGGTVNGVELHRETTAGPGVNLYRGSTSYSGGWGF